MNPGISFETNKQNIKLKRGILMTKFVTLTLCLLFALTFNAVAQETSDTQAPVMQKPAQPCQIKMMKKCAKMKDMTPEQKQAMMKNCSMMKKCSENK